MKCMNQRHGVARSTEIAAPEVTATLSDVTLVSDAEAEPVVEVISLAVGVVTDEQWSLVVACKVASYSSGRRP